MRRLTHTIVNLGLFVLCLILFDSCVYHQLKDENFTFKQLPNARWEAGQSVFFDMLVEAYQQPYSCDLILRHNNDYKYTRIKFIYDISLNGDLVETDTVTQSLVNEHNQWIGNGISLREVPICLFRKKRMNRAGVYTVKLRTPLHNVPLPGVESIGLRIWKE
ncbi:gliding motility lipoprotein GldH [Falsiporphyromonas endometrii]|uniref:Gliding motility lipoprotein GldH n=1 Tax=Falsiporphyromonas endometrii TaxID=1387297 RepID=A0ABV9K8Y0_9PORP